MERFKSYFKNRTRNFYIAFGVSCLTFVTGIVYMATLHGLTDKFSFAPGILLILSSVLFNVLALFRMSKIGSALLAAMSFIAIMIFIVTIFDYILTQAMTAFEFSRINGIGAIITSAVLMIVCSVCANIFAWLRLDINGSGAETDGGKE